MTRLDAKNKALEIVRSWKHRHEFTASMGISVSNPVPWLKWLDLGLGTIMFAAAVPLMFSDVSSGIVAGLGAAYMYVRSWNQGITTRND